MEQIFHIPLEAGIQKTDAGRRWIEARAVAEKAKNIMCGRVAGAVFGFVLSHPFRIERGMNGAQKVRAGGECSESRSGLDPLALAHEGLGDACCGYAIDVELAGADHPVDMDEALVGALGG